MLEPFSRIFSLGWLGHLIKHNGDFLLLAGVDTIRLVVTCSSLVHNPGLAMGLEIYQDIKILEFDSGKAML